MKVNVTVDRIIFENTQNGFTVMAVTDNTSVSYRHFKAVATTVGIEKSMNLLLEGNWDSNNKYGRTFKVERWEEVLPTNSHGMECYLGSGLIKGVGETLAKAIVEKFGDRTLEIIDTHSEEIFEVSKIKRKKAEQIWKSWDEHKHMRVAISFLLSYGVSVTMAIKIFKVYEKETINIIKKNPYCLVYDVDGIGFARADEIAQKLGKTKNDPERIKAGITFCLQMSAEDGNTYMESPELLSKAAKLLEVEWKDVLNVINSLKDDEIVIVENNRVYLPLYYSDEERIANKLRLMASSMSTFNSGQDIDVSLIEEELGIKYEPEQISAIKTALRSNVMVLTGGPGTGKTTVTRGILRALMDANYNVECAAPTGKAAERMSEATGVCAKTIHRMLKFRPGQGPQFDENNPFPYDAIILDECSMINILLMDIFLKAVKYSTKLIFIGDVDQLPSIGAGNVLNDIIASNTVPVVKLEKIFRQAQTSRIITNAHKINKGIIPDFSNNGSKDFFFLPASSSEEASKTIIDLMSRRLPKAYNVDPKNIQLLTPMKIGNLGTVKMNESLQAILNPVGREIKYGTTTFRVGDKVMQIKNDYDKGVFNGDTGIITDVDEDARTITVQYKDISVVYEQGDFDELILAYASTIHKSQGSEYDIVVIPILSEHYVMLQRNLLYTAITRAKKVCIIVGDKRMFAYGVKNVTIDKRFTSLKERLTAEV